LRAASASAAARALSLLAVLLVALAAPIGAEEPVGEQKARAVRGGVYDKPFSQHLRGRTALGGYAEIHYRWERDDGILEEASFVVPRFNLFTATEVSDWVTIAAELEFEDGGEEIKLEYAAVDLLLIQGLAVRAGMVLSPIGRFNLSHDSPLNEFTDRPLVSTQIIPTTLSEPGLGLLGLISLGENLSARYELYAVNGFDDGILTASPGGTRIPEGRGNFEDNNNEPAFAGRTSLRFGQSAEVGISLHSGAYNVWKQDGLETEERRTLDILALDWDASWRAFAVSGEAARAAIDIPPGLASLFAGRQAGVYIQVVRRLGRGRIRSIPESDFGVGARWDAVDFDRDLDGDSESRATGLLNYRPTPDTALKLDFFRGWSRDRFNVQAKSAGVLASVATYF